MEKILHILGSLLLSTLALQASCKSTFPVEKDIDEKHNIQLKVFQLNTWQEDTTVPNGLTGIADIIDQIDPDIVLLCEIRNYNNKPFIPKLVSRLDRKGRVYYGERRGYSGTTCKKIDEPVTDVVYILEANRLATRDEPIEALKDASKETLMGNIVIMGEDFNEPSHFDWLEDTKNLWYHNGLVINSDCSSIPIKTNYKDTNREIYLNDVKYSGFTLSYTNYKLDISKLSYGLVVDERDKSYIKVEMYNS